MDFCKVHTRLIRQSINRLVAFTFLVNGTKCFECVPVSTVSRLVLCCRVLSNEGRVTSNKYFVLAPSKQMHARITAGNFSIVIVVPCNRMSLFIQRPWPERVHWQSSLTKANCAPSDAKSSLLLLNYSLAIHLAVHLA